MFNVLRSILRVFGIGRSEAVNVLPAEDWNTVSADDSFKPKLITVNVSGSLVTFTFQFSGFETVYTESDFQIYTFDLENASNIRMMYQWVDSLNRKAGISTSYIHHWLNDFRCVKHNSNHDGMITMTNMIWELIDCNYMVSSNDGKTNWLDPESGSVSLANGVTIEIV